MIRQNTKREFEKKLMRRGMVKMTDGTILKAPIRNYRTLGEEILWMMNEADISLCVDDLSRYLVTDKKTIQKVMRKLTASNVNLVKKRKVGSVYHYTANFKKDLDIPTLYKLTRMEATRYIR
jgi:hypothetical protein